MHDFDPQLSCLLRQIFGIVQHLCLGHHPFDSVMQFASLCGELILELYEKAGGVLRLEATLFFMQTALGLVRRKHTVHFVCWKLKDCNDTMLFPRK